MCNHHFISFTANYPNRLQKVEANNFGSRSVLLHMLAAPINPADINQIQGQAKIQLSLFWSLKGKI